MIRKYLLTAIFALGVIVTSSANEQISITIDNENRTTATAQLPYGNLVVSLQSVDGNDIATCLVEMENIDETKTLLIFARAYDEKVLKKNNPRVKYDKVFGGSKGKRIVDCCLSLRQDLMISSSESKQICNLTGPVESPLVIKLPVYVAKYKNKKRSQLLLMAKDVVELVVNVDLKPDKDLLLIKNDYDILMKSLDSETFCRNKNHQGESFESLKIKYTGQINELKHSIDSVLLVRGYDQSEKAYQRFFAVSAALDTISLDDRAVDSCPLDKVIHKCRYCSLSYEEIYRKLEQHYIDIHIGKKTKTQVMPDVEALYNCSVKNTSRSRNSKFKSGIKKYYNQIKAL